MQSYTCGRLVISKAGHDKNRIYVIIKEEEQYVYLSDGKYRPLQKLKKKKKKHVQYMNEIDETLKDRLDTIRDEDIRKVIQKMKK